MGNEKKLPSYMGSMIKEEKAPMRDGFLQNNAAAKYYDLDAIITEKEDRQFLASILQEETGDKMNYYDILDFLE